MIYSKEDINNFERQFRIDFINQLSGVRAVHLIGTKSKSAIANLAIFNSVCHVGANPAAMGFLMRPLTVDRHTYQNIMETNCFTINHFQKEHLENAHLSSAKFEQDVSEFDHLDFTEEYIPGFHAPFVKESYLSIGLTFTEKHEIKLNGTIFMVGEIVYVKVKKDLVEKTGHLKFTSDKAVCVAGLDTYYSVKKLKKLDYAQISEAK